MEKYKKEIFGLIVVIDIEYMSAHEYQTKRELVRYIRKNKTMLRFFYVFNLVCAKEYQTLELFQCLLTFSIFDQSLNSFVPFTNSEPSSCFSCLFLNSNKTPIFLALTLINYGTLCLLLCPAS